MNITLEEAYAEACRVIGEQIVERRLLSRVLAEEMAPPEDAEKGVSIPDPSPHYSTPMADET